MFTAAITFWLSDFVVEKIHSLTKIPWEESINDYLPPALPHEGLGLPILLGRLVWIGLLAGILIALLSRSRLGLRFSLKRADGLSPFTVYTVPVAVCLWVEFFIIKALFFYKGETIFHVRWVAGIPGFFMGIFTSGHPIVNILYLLFGILILVLALLALVIPLILPALYFGDLKGHCGKLAPLYFLEYLGLFSGCFGLLIVAVYYAFATGFAKAALNVALILIICGVVLYFAVMGLVLFLSATLIGIIRILQKPRWKRALERVEEGYKKHGENYRLTVNENGEEKVLRGKNAVDYVRSHGGVFKDDPDL